MSLLRKYKISYKSAIQHWLRQYGYEDRHVKVRYLSYPTVAMENKKEQEAESATEQVLKERLKQLERQLEEEKIRSQAYERMIELAEKEFKIAIRKKSSTR